MKLIKKISIVTSTVLVMILVGTLAFVAGASQNKAAPATPAMTTTVRQAPSAGQYDPKYGPNYTEKVVLTFDDCVKQGDNVDDFKRVVTAAKKLDIGLVLAPLGDCLKDQKFDAQWAREQGMYVINHSLTHANYTELTPEQIVPELQEPAIVSNYVRPPFGAHDAKVDAVLAQQGKKMWLWSTSTEDWLMQPSEIGKITEFFVVNAKPRDTVLLHMHGPAFDERALAMIKAGLENRSDDQGGKLELCRPYPGTTPTVLPDSIPC